MKNKLLILTASVCLLALGCTETMTEKVSLKESLDQNINNLNQALNIISSSEGYKLLNSGTGALKSETEYNDSILLEMVSGIYEFSPYPYRHHNFFIPFRLFKKTGDSDKLIVKMPQKLAFRPLYLRSLNNQDSLLKKDFTITADEYQYLYSWFYKYDYKLSAGFMLDETELGNLSVSSKRNSENGTSVLSSYTFTEGYNIEVSHMTGDTTESSFALMEDDKILMKETTLWIRTDETRKRERQYILSIGNIDIKRGSELDSIQVYLDGVLQKTAAAKIVDSTATDGSICHQRDILLTFDDGTTAKLSELIDPVRDILKNLVDSLRSMNFAKNVVDYIAISIYYHNNH